MTEYNITPLIAMFVTRPVPFIDSISTTFFDKDYSLNDQTLMITVLDQGIKQLSNPPPKKVEVEDISTDFYFKKLSSKYFTEDRKPEKKEPSNTRRWGHTLRAYEEKLHPEKMSLNIVTKN
jgi:phosphoglycolate phosphatase-like HAD superfamily hydrolase